MNPNKAFRQRKSPTKSFEDMPAADVQKSIIRQLTVRATKKLGVYSSPYISACADTIGPYKPVSQLTEKEARWIMAHLLKIIRETSS